MTGYDETLRHAYWHDGDPDVVAACVADGRERHRAAVSARRHDLCDRRLRRRAELDREAWWLARAAPAACRLARRSRRAVRLSRAVFHLAALRAPGRSGPGQLPLAAADRAVLGAAARRTARAA